jgi:hypothetical protein
MGADRTLAGNKEDDSNDIDIENTVESEDEKEGKTDTSSPFNKNSFWLLKRRKMETMLTLKQL